MIIVTYRKVFFALTGILILASVASIAFFGLKLGTDFTGGTLAEVSYSGAKPDVAAVSQALESVGITGYSLRESEAGYTLRAGNLPQDVRAKFGDIVSIGGQYPASIDRFTDVGPIIGKELRNKAFIAIGLVLLCILLFIAFAFRKVSQPVSSWVYGLIALVTLLHDVIVPAGFFALLGHLFGAQVDALFVTALLTIIGFSIHDTIVVFDRVRENLRLNQERRAKEDFEVTAGRSLNQTFVRSVNTSLTVLIALGALFFLGPVSTEDFALTLIVGILAGTFSSIALATPLLVAIAKWQGKA